ncbi:TIGR01440 family protein [Halobacillus fulvus]|nr:TIGR01440 family protein [Halobacillus fulvus]
MVQLQAIRTGAKEIVNRLVETKEIHNGIFVIGCSTSEIAGERIGTAGSEELASVVFEELNKLEERAGVKLAFQCCEHLNRALVVERHVAESYGLTIVAAIPVPKAGGSMASFAFKQMEDPVLVETIQADAGLDIGDTLIGMHLKRVAVPLRVGQTSLGHAHITAAKTRPPLIGGARAVYERSQVEGSCDE